MKGRRPAIRIRVARSLALLVALALGACDAAPPIVPGRVESQVGGAVSAVAVAGERAWLGAGQRLQGVDLSDPARPRALGQSEALPATIRALALDETMAYAAIGVGGLAILDLSDPEQPRHLATWPTRWAINDVALSGDRIYLAEGALGLRILRRPAGASEIPIQAEALGSVDTPGDALAVAVDGDRAFVADWGTGLRVIDVSDARAPREIGFVDTPGEAADVAQLGEDRLLVADRSGGLRVLDLSRADAPREIAALALPGVAERLAVREGWAYVAAQDGGLLTVDLRDPAHPQPGGRLEGVTVAVDLVLDGDRLFTADLGSSLPPVRDSRDDLWARAHVWGAEMGPDGAAGVSALHVTGLSEDGAMQPIGRFASPSLVEGVAVDAEAGLLYAADGRAGVLVMDLADPARPALLNQVEMSGKSHALILDGSRIYVADGPAGLSILDRSDPRRPVFEASIATPGESYGLALGEAGRIYAAVGQAGLATIDVGAGKLVGETLDSPGFGWDVKRQGDLLYLADRNGGLRIYTLDGSDTPQWLAETMAGRGDVLDIALDEDWAWVAAGPSGLYALNLQVPSNPKVEGQLRVGDRAIGLELNGDTAYVAAGEAGLRQIDIRDRQAPREVAAWSFPGAAERILRFGEYLYVSAETGGLQVIRLR